MKSTKILVLILFSFYFASAQAPLKNSIRFYTGDFTDFNLKKIRSPINCSGFSYQRRIGNKYWVGVKYDKMNLLKSDKEYFNITAMPDFGHKYLRNLHLFTSGLSTVEFNVVRMFYLDTLHNRIGVSLGVCESFGNAYQKSFAVLNSDSSYAHILKYPFAVYNIGLVPEVMYEYCFLNSRINLGMDLRYFFFRNYHYFRFEYSLHAGINF